MTVSLLTAGARAISAAGPTKGDVIVIESDQDARETVTNLLRCVGFVVTSFSSPVEFLSASFEEEPSCILFDVRLRGMSGLDLQEHLVRDGSRSKIIFITGSADVTTSVRAMKAGAFDFLQKPFREDEVIDAVRRADDAYNERVHFFRALAAFAKRFRSLTTREKEVLIGVVDGQLNKQIAASLGLSEITVKVHRASLMKKMQARTVAHLVKDVSLHVSFDERETTPLMPVFSTLSSKRPSLIDRIASATA